MATQLPLLPAEEAATEIREENIRVAAWNLFHAFGQLRVWARCVPGCGWCGPGASHADRERHLAAVRLVRALQAGQ